MSRRLFCAWVLVCVAALSAAACDSVDLKTAIEVTDVSSGYYDNGLKDGLNHLVPSLTFSVRNVSENHLSSVDMIVMFWAEGQDTEQDEVIVKVIDGAGVDPGASSDPIVVRSKIGYTMAQPRAELFMHRDFVDWTAKLFAKRGGKIVPAGEFKIERRLLLNVPSESGGNPLESTIR